MNDSYRHRGLRRKLLNELRQSGISDESVLLAMDQVPRHYFLDKAFEEKAYQNRAFSIGVGQTISQPYTVARMTELLQVRKRSRILEVGTGSGYQAAILAQLGARVFTLERQKVLYEHSKALLNMLCKGGVRVYFKDGYKGLPEFAPFEGIIVTAAAPEVPQALLDQLAVGGRLVIPVSVHESGRPIHQQLMVYVRRSQDDFEKTSHGIYQFVPLLSGKNTEES